MNREPLPQDEHPGNVFAAQLAKGFNTLRFDEPLDTRYKHVMRQEQRIPAMLCTCMGLVIWFAFAVSDIYRLGGWAQLSLRDEMTALVLDSRALGLVGLILSLLYLLRGGLHYDRLNLLVYIILGAAVSITANIIEVKGSFSMESAQILIVMAAFLPIGLTFWQALTAASLITLSAFLTTSLLPVSALAIKTELLVMMPLATIVAALGGYAREYVHREQFLLRGILRLQASTDALTGLSNRRAFIKHMSTALKQGTRDNKPVLLALVDIDHFKRYNDHYGHSDGDITLQRVASVLQQAALRPMDMAARVGGEEFAILLYDATPAQATAVLERTRAAVQSLAIEHLPTEEGIVTISIGVTEFAVNESQDDVYRRADAMLYQAKQNGRNRVCNNEAPPVTPADRDTTIATAHA